MGARRGAGSVSWFNRLWGGGSRCNSERLTFGVLGRCKPDQVARGPQAAWGVAGMSQGQRAPMALFEVVHLTASESNKPPKKNHLDSIIVNFFSLLFHFGGRQAAPLFSVC